MKTTEKLNALKGEYETMNKKLAELTEEELELVSGGGFCPLNLRATMSSIFSAPYVVRH